MKRYLNVYGVAGFSPRVKRYMNVYGVAGSSPRVKRIQTGSTKPQRHADIWNSIDPWDYYLTLKGDIYVNSPSVKGLKNILSEGLTHRLCLLICT